MAQTQYSVPKQMKERYEEIVAITDNFCQTHLNDEYAEMCRKLTAALSRKRPSPLSRGRVKNWAAAIVYTIGRINFLFDKSQTPFMEARELCCLLGVSQKTIGSKSTEIMRLLDLMQMEPEYTLPSMIDKNPLVWMISVNGFLMDVRYAPREIQEEAFRRGLIPYIPE